MVNRVWLSLAAAFACAGAAGAAGAADRLVAVSVTDELLDAPTVGADAVVVGLVRQGAETGRARAVLAAMPPKERGGAEICLRVQTEDGLYTGAGTYAEPGPGRDPFALLPYETSRARIYDYPSRAVALLVHPCAPADPMRIALASWGAEEDDAPSGDAELLVNSFRADRVFVALPDGSVADCVRQTEGERAAFDFRCPIAVPALQGGGLVTVYRARGASLDPPVEVDVIGWE